MKSHELDGASDPANHDEHSEHQDSGHDSEHPELTHGQNSLESHQDPATEVEHEDSEDIRHVLVNNFRPVQPLHGRTVYRSFPFFDAPIPEKCSNSPVAVSAEESHAGSFSTKSTLLNLVGSSMACNSYWPVQNYFLARLFSKKTSRYCHSPGVNQTAPAQTDLDFISKSMSDGQVQTRPVLRATSVSYDSVHTIYLYIYPLRNEAKSNQEPEQSIAKLAEVGFR